ncbi:ACP S-malonyltransferase [Clostridium botulinum]|nr:ACP S-malonyltransferase [Clostridium botulinum]
MKKNAFIFPGQGSHYIGMGKSIYDKYDVAKRIFNRANKELGYDIKRICFEGNLVELSKIDIMLTAIMTVSVASFNVLLEEYGIEPNFLAGHSLGEYSALTCSGAIEFGDAIRLVEKRSKLAMKAFENTDASMSIIENVDFNTISRLCISKSPNVSIACINGKDQFAISGYSNAIEDVENELLIEGGQVTPLLYSLPFHSSLMQEVSIELEDYLKNIKFKSFKYKVISNVDANVYKNENEIISKLVKQIKNPVQWDSTIRFFTANNVENLIEVGSQKILSNIIAKDNKHFNLFSFSVAEDRKRIRENISSKYINELKYNNYVKLMERSLTEAVTTKNKCFNIDLYKSKVIDKYLEIEKWINECNEDDNFDYINIFKKTLENLKCIYDTKGICINEQRERFNKLVKDSNIDDIDISFIDELFINEPS